MKNKKNLICLLGGLVLWLSGFWLVRRSGISWETLRALPYLMIGIGCGLFGYGVGEMVNRRVLDSNPTLAKEQEIAQKDERNVALANRAKAKAYDLMTYMMAALLLTFALMGVARLSSCWCWPIWQSSFTRSIGGSGWKRKIKKRAPFGALFFAVVKSPGTSHTAACRHTFPSPPAAAARRTAGPSGWAGCAGRRWTE